MPPQWAGYAESLAAIKDWTFKLGPGFVVGIGNGLILGYLMYRSGLMPRGLALLGMIGGPLQTPCGHRRAVRPLRRRRAGAGHRDDPRDHLGALARHLPADLGIQVVSHPRRRKGAPFCILPWKPVELNRALAHDARTRKNFRRHLGVVDAPVLADGEPAEPGLVIVSEPAHETNPAWLGCAHHQTSAGPSREMVSAPHRAILRPRRRFAPVARISGRSRRQTPAPCFQALGGDRES